MILNGVAQYSGCLAIKLEMDDQGIVNLKSVIETYTTVIEKNKFYLSCKLYIYIGENVAKRLLKWVTLSKKKRYWF